MEISVIGSGYVGLVQAAVLADVGHQVICMDVDRERIERLRTGDIPFYEPGLSGMVSSGVDSGLLSFTDDARSAIEQSQFPPVKTARRICSMCCRWQRASPSI